MEPILGSSHQAAWQKHLQEKLQKPGNYLHEDLPKKGALEIRHTQTVPATVTPLRIALQELNKRASEYR